MVNVNKELAQLGAKLILESVRKEAFMSGVQRLLAKDTEIQTLLKKQISDLVTAKIKNAEQYDIEVSDYAIVRIYRVIARDAMSTTKQKVVDVFLTKLFDKVPYDFLVNDKKLTKQRLSDFETIASRIYEGGY